MEISKAESIVIATILADGNGSMKAAAELLTPADFSGIQNQKIFFKMLGNYKTNRPIELPALELDKFALAQVDDHLNQSLPRKENLRHYILQVKENSQRLALQRVLAAGLDERVKDSATIADEVGKALRSFRPISDVRRDVFVDFERLVSTIPEEIDWMVDGIIERGANGIIAGVPKASKSWIAGDLGLSVALGTPWMGFGVTRPVKVALISREDNPGLTSWRLRALAKSKAATADLRLLKTNFIVNTRQQTDSLMLDEPRDVQEITDLLQRQRVEFAVFDVLNVMHRKDENDNQEMRLVLERLTEIQQKVRCAIAVVHHFNKLQTGTWTERLRGSSAISGWVEWLIGVTMADEAEKTRKLEFELKASEPPKPLYYQIRTEGNMAWLGQVDFVEKKNGAKGLIK